MTEHEAILLDKLSVLAETPSQTERLRSAKEPMPRSVWNGAVAGASYILGD